MAERFFIAPDAEQEPSVWVEGADPDMPIALVRRCDVANETWSLIVLGVAAQAVGERTENCVEAMHLHVGICQRAGYRNGRLDAAEELWRTAQRQEGLA
jgi:hypothetical protein